MVAWRPTWASAQSWSTTHRHHGSGQPLECIFKGSAAINTSQIHRFYPVCIKMTTAVAVRTDSARRLLFLVTSVGRTSDAITITLDESLPTECLVPEGTAGCTLKAAAVFLTGLSTQTTQLLGVEPKEIQTQVGRPKECLFWAW